MFLFWPQAHHLCHEQVHYTLLRTLPGLWEWAPEGKGARDAPGSQPIFIVCDASGTR